MFAHPSSSTSPATDARQRSHSGGEVIDWGHTDGGERRVRRARVPRRDGGGAPWRGPAVAVPVVGAVLGLIGSASLEILLAHVIVAAGLRVVLVQMSVLDPVVHMLVGTVAGLVMPFVIRVVVRRLCWEWVFGLPGPLRFL